MIYIAHINQSSIQSCEQHCKETAQIARTLLQGVNLGGVAYLAGLIHDCGKFTDEFNEYIQKAVHNERVIKGQVIHSFAGVVLMLKRYHSGEDTYALITAELIAYAVGSHHGLFDVYDEAKICGFEHRLKKQTDYDDRAISHFFRECCNEAELDLLFLKAKDEIEGFFEKLVPIEHNEVDCGFYIGFLARLITSAVIHADRTNTADFESSRNEKQTDNTVAWDVLSEKMQDKLMELPCQTPIQKARGELSDICSHFSENPNGIYRLNLPTGAGKTLSSLRYALKHCHLYHKKRIFYIAPLITILKQNADEWKKYLGEDVVLEHHSDVVQEKVSEQEEISYHNLTQTWDAQVIVTTLVQFLNTLFSAKTSCIRRLQSLTDAVIILDEVQSVPAKLLNLFNLALNFLSVTCNTTVLLCSATQPCLENTEYPLILSEREFLTKEQYVHYANVFKRNEILPLGSKTLEELLSLVAERINETNSVLVVCNKKAEAEQIFGRLNKIGGILLFHLSASMCSKHRDDVLKAMFDALEKKKKLICISTQVIEAGVDVSFGSVIRLCAGMDSVIQSAGRCNRNGETPVKAPVYVVNLIGENLNSLREIRDAKGAALALLGEFEKHPENFDNDLTSDNAIAFYYRYLYKNMKAGYRDFSVAGTTLLALLSENKDNRNEQYSQCYLMTQALKTAGKLFRVFDENTIPVLVPYQKGEELINELYTLNPQWDASRIYEITKALKPYCIAVFENAFEILKRNQSVVPVCTGLFYALRQDCYDNDVGFILNQQRSETENCNILIL